VELAATSWPSETSGLAVEENSDIRFDMSSSPRKRPRKQMGDDGLPDVQFFKTIGYHVDIPRWRPPGATA